jgi:hypothetical protein
MKYPVTLFVIAVSPLAVRAADLTGVWKAEFQTQIGVEKYTYALKQDGAHITSSDGEKREVELNEGPTEGDMVMFVENLPLQDPDQPPAAAATANRAQARRQAGVRSGASGLRHGA